MSGRRLPEIELSLFFASACSVTVVDLRRVASDYSNLATPRGSYALSRKESMNAPKYCRRRVFFTSASYYFSDICVDLDI